MIQVLTNAEMPRENLEHKVERQLGEGKSLKKEVSKYSKLGISSWIDKQVSHIDVPNPNLYKRIEGISKLTSSQNLNTILINSFLWETLL